VENCVAGLAGNEGSATDRSGHSGTADAGDLIMLRFIHVCDDASLPVGPAASGTGSTEALAEMEHQ
jgi:hypothetical protein